MIGIVGATYRPRRLRAVAVACVVVSAMLGGGLGTAEAGNDRVTRGEAQAGLNAFGNGGWAILNHHDVALGSSVVELGAPADGALRASIRPMAGSPWDGRHFCAQDWHVILIAGISSNDGAPWSLQQARGDLDPVVIEFTLDGAPLPTNRTAIKRFLRFADIEAYYFQQGVVLSPSDLGPGSHSVSIVQTLPDDTITDGITFFIDAAGTGACQ